MPEPVLDSTRSAAWRYSRWVMVKSTGFPFEILESLRDDRLRTLVAATRRHEATAGDIDLVLREAVEGLVKTYATPRFYEAVFLSSPLAYETVSNWLAKDPSVSRLDSSARRRVRLLTKYLQRLCAKNESTSFFGPVYWGVVGDGAGIEVDVDNSAQPRPMVFWSHWAAEAVARRMIADVDVAANVVPYVPPSLFESEDGYRFATFAVHPNTVESIPPPEDDLATVLKLCDGRRTVLAIAESLGTGVADTIEALERLRDRRLVGFDLAPPVGVLYPFTHLTDVTRSLPAGPRERWEATLGGLERRRLEFQNAHGLESRRAAYTTVSREFTAVTGVAAERAAGVHYADRAVVNEDCAQPWRRFAVGGPLDTYLRTELPPLVELLFELSLARRHARIAEITTWFERTFGQGADRRLDEVVHAAEPTVSDLAVRLRAIDDNLRTCGPSAISDALFDNLDRSRVELDMEWARARADGVDFDTWCVSGADLFVRAVSTAAVADNDFSVVVGEVHGLHDQLLQGYFPELHPNPDRLAEEIAGIIGGLTTGTICDPTMIHWRKTTGRVDALPDVEFVGRSRRGPGGRVSANQLRVRMRDGRLELYGGGFEDIQLTRPPLESWADEIESVFTAFSGARLVCMEETIRDVDPGIAHLPRLTVGRTTLSRESWQLPTYAGGKWPFVDARNQLAGWRLKDDLGLPDQVYAKFVEEPKPLFVDFDNPLLVEVFVRSWQRTAGAAWVSEMLPGPDELWLTDERGRYSAELRFGLYRGFRG